MGLVPQFTISEKKPLEEDGDLEMTPKPLAHGEARIVRDDDGKILRIEHAEAEQGSDPDEMETDARRISMKNRKVYGAEHPLLQNLIASSVDEIKPEVIPEIDEVDRKWLFRLKAKHGTNYDAMGFDMKLNPYQETADELRTKMKHLQYHLRQEGKEELEV